MASQSFRNPNKPVFQRSRTVLNVSGEMTPRIDTSKVMTVAAAAAELKISRQAVWLAISKGRLKTVAIGGVTFVSKQSLQQYLKTRRPGGPKSKRHQT